MINIKNRSGAIFVRKNKNMNNNTYNKNYKVGKGGYGTLLCTMMIMCNWEVRG